MPLLQVVSKGHALPQDAQLALSFWGLRQTPLIASGEGLQQRSPGSQAMNGPHVAPAPTASCDSPTGSGSLGGVSRGSTAHATIDDTASHATSPRAPPIHLHLIMITSDVCVQ